MARATCSPLSDKTHQYLWEREAEEKQDTKEQGETGEEKEKEKEGDEEEAAAVECRLSQRIIILLRVQL